MGHASVHSGRTAASNTEYSQQTIVGSTAVEWDSAITLAFAAEQLFAAAQLLTSDLVPCSRALRAAHERHILPLLENDTLLPSSIREKLRDAHQSYLAAEGSGLTPEFARQLASELTSILSEITQILSQVSAPSLADLSVADLNPRAA